MSGPNNAVRPGSAHQNANSSSASRGPGSIVQPLNMQVLARKRLEVERQHTGASQRTTDRVIATYDLGLASET